MPDDYSVVDHRAPLEARMPRPEHVAEAREKHLKTLRTSRGATAADLVERVEAQQAARPPAEREAVSRFFDLEQDLAEAISALADASGRRSDVIAARRKAESRLSEYCENEGRRVVRHFHTGNVGNAEALDAAEKNLSRQAERLAEDVILAREELARIEPRYARAQARRDALDRLVRACREELRRRGIRVRADDEYATTLSVGGAKP